MNLRLSVGGRILATLCAVASFSTAAALLLQDRSLSRDLREAAKDRLEHSAETAEILLIDYLRAIEERYRAVAGTPQFRANLETQHAQTLAFFADRLAEQQESSLVIFLDAEGRSIAHGGVLAQPAPTSLAWRAIELALAQGAETPRLLPSEGFDSTEAPEPLAYAAAFVPLRTDGRPLGSLVAVEPIAPGLLERWSQLSGAELLLGAASKDAQAAEPQMSLAVELPSSSVAIRVVASLDPEKEAIANSRESLLAAGAVALLLAFGASVAVAQGLVRPIREIQRATEKIAEGDLGLRLSIRRSDEIGEVASTFNVMLGRLEKTQGRLESAQRLAKLGNWGIDLASGEVHVSSELCRILEIHASETVPTRELILSRIHQDDRTRFEQALDACLREGTPFRLDHRAVSSDGSERILHSQGERIDGDERPLRFEGTVQDISERKLVEEQVRYLAYHDSLTGLGNSRLFQERLALALDEGRRDSSELSVMFLDLDHFKFINDTLGHSVGDQLLRCVADRLVNCLQQSAPWNDLGERPPGVTVSRLGGDEFTILLTGLRDATNASEAARRILDVVAEPFQIGTYEVVVRGSIGITVWPRDGDDVETLLRNSDTAMYHAKKAGRDNFQFYTEPMKVAVVRRMELEQTLRQAVEREQLELHYQPKVDLASGRVCGLEALLRWRLPDGSVILPDEFVPVAEETGIIFDIGKWVLSTAVHQLKLWQEQGLGPLRVSINLSPPEIEDPRLVETVRELLRETGVPPAILELEITESTLMRDDEAAIATLSALRGLGVGLSLDDFGTGYSSLSYLRRLPIDTLKIDRSFVERVATDPDDASVAAAIVSMAKALRLRVVVEGVETEAQREVLAELGCDEIQGHLVSAAVPVDEVERVVAEIAKGAKKRTRRRTPGKAKSRAPRSRS